MKNVKLAILGLCLSATSLIAQTTTRPDARVVTHLNEFRQGYEEAMLTGNPQSLLTYYADSVRVAPELQKTLIGKKNTSSYYQAFLKRFDVEKCDRDEIEILDLGGQILEIGKITLALVLKSSGEKFELSGTYLNLWEKAPDHKLLLITDAWNYDRHYGEIHEYLRFDEVPGVHMALLPNVTITDHVSWELTAYNRLLDAAVTEHDANTWGHFFAEDAILIPNYHDYYRGKDEINKYIEMHVKELPIFEELDIRHDRIDNLGDFIVEYASHIASWRNGESSGVSLGKNIRIWRRENDHSLKLFRSITMYD